jgi:phosphoesterase RecJ-like protein
MAIYERFKRLTKEVNNIIITTHLFPDADGIGSQIALCEALNSLGKKTVCVNEEELLDRYKYLDPKGYVLSRKKFLEKYSPSDIEFTIIVDTNTLSLIGTNMDALVREIGPHTFVDHHPCSPEVHDANCIDTTMAATGQLVGNLITYLGIEFTKEMGLALYTAILIDTSSFRYPTVTGETHRTIAKCIDAGVFSPYAYNMIYGTKKVSHMQMLGTVLASAQTTEDESISWIVLKTEVLNRYDVDVEDTHAFINNLLILDNIKVACMFRELQNNKVKLSLRSAGNADVGIIARTLGGGGHDHSSATIMEGSVEEVVTKAILSIEQMLGKE